MSFTCDDPLPAASAADLGPAEFYCVDADNNLYGLQVGADAVLFQPSDYFRIDGIIRAGILGNAADQTTQAPFLSNFNGFDDRVSVSDSETSYMAELGLRGVLQLTNSLSVFGGYQVLWLDVTQAQPR